MKSHSLFWFLPVSLALLVGPALSAQDTAAPGPPHQVVIGCRFLRCSRAAAQEVFGVLPGLGRQLVLSKDVLERLGAAERGREMTELCDLRVPTISGQSAQFRAVTEYRYVAGYNEDDTPNINTRELGGLLNVTPTVDADGQTVNLTVIPEHSTLLQPVRTAKITLPRSGKSAAVELPRIVSHNLTTQVAVNSGETMLIGVGPSIERDGQTTPDSLVLVLLTATVVGTK